MQEMLFEDRCGQPIGLLPHRQDGSARVADGIKIYTLEQAAGHFPAWSQQALRELWEATFQDVAAMVAQDQEAREAAGDPAGRPASVAAVLDGPAGLDLLRSVMYPYLEEDEFRVFLQVCRERDVNPWLRRVIPKVERDDQGKRRIAYVTTVEQLRITAERTGKYAGQSRPRWCDGGETWTQVWSKEEPPAAAEVGVLKTGFTEMAWGVVMFEELAQRDEKGNLEESWEKMPALMLAKCAEAAALRKAFPDECGGFYLREELRPRPLARGAAAVAAVAARDATGPVAASEAGRDEEDDSLPKTERQFRLAMIDLVGSRRVDAVIDGFRREFGLRMLPAQFFAAAVRAVRDNPQLYGLQDEMDNAA